MAATQGHMQYRALFGGVDGVATEHGFGLVHHMRFIGQGQQLLQNISGDTLTRIVERDACTTGVQLLRTVWVFQQLTQMRLRAV